MPTELTFLSVQEIVRKIQEEDVSAEELVTAHLQRIEEVNPRLNAVVVFADDALDRARAADGAMARGESWGPLHGVPMTIKDSLDTAGVVTTWGTPGRKRFVPDRDATVVARLKNAGAILLGKTNTPEFTLLFETNNPVYGQTRNPYNLDRSPGGSSGGAAAIVAAGGSPFDIGSDTGGSIRLPAHFCGIAGIRPTSGRVPRTGHAIPFGGLTDLFTTIGPLARTVDDLALLLSVIAGPDGHDPAIVPMPLGDPTDVRLRGLRAVYFTDNGVVSPTGESTRCVEQAVAALVEAGVAVVEQRPPRVEETFDLLRGMLNATGRAWEKMALARAGTSLEETSMHFVHTARALAPDELVRLHDRWDRFRQDVARFFQPYDLIISPINASPAIPIGTLDDHILAYTYTMTWNLTGYPAAVVRVGTSPEGLPIGVQVVAHPWREDVALAAAAHLEEAFGGWQRPPL